MSTAPVPFTKFLPSPGSLYVLSEHEGEYERNEVEYSQRDDDPSFAVSRLEFLEVDPGLRSLLVLVVYMPHSVALERTHETTNSPICSTRKEQP